LTDTFTNVVTINLPAAPTFQYDLKGDQKVSVNSIAIFPLEAQDAAWRASYEWNIRARFITS
jgi:hypothetical protein